MPTAPINGVNLYYEDTGSGRPIVLAHGFSATCRMWAPQVEAFRDRYRVIVYDARGQGRSQVPADPASFSQPLMVEDLRGLLRHLGIERALVGGLSMGGNVALNFGLAHPEMVEGLLICDTGAGSDDAEGWAGKVREWVRVLESNGIEAFAEAFISDPILADYAMQGPPARNLLWRCITSNTAEGLARGLSGVVGNRPSIYSLKARMAKLDVPTLVVVGDRDHWCTKVSRFIAETIPGAELVVIKDSGHMTNLERPAEFNEALTRLLGRASGRAAGA